MKRKYGTKKLLIKGILSMALSLSMMVGAVSMDGLVMTAHAGPSASKTTITGLGAGAIRRPVVPESKDSAWSGSYVYYGTYNGSPVKYRVLDLATNKFGGVTMFLDCDSVLFNLPFRKDSNAADANQWAKSDIFKALNTNPDSFLNTSFSEVEKRAIVESRVEEHKIDENLGQPMRQYFPTYTALSGEKIFLLDFEDILNEEYGYHPDCGGTDLHDVESRKKSGDKAWWLRSPSTFSIFTDRYIPCFVGSVLNGAIGNCTFVDLGAYENQKPLGVSPAFNVNHDSVIFSSLISGTEKKPGAEYKLTLKDDDLKISPGAVTRAGTTVTVPYEITGSHSGNATQVSVLITDRPYSGRTARTIGFTYKKLSMNVWRTSGTGTFTLPDKYANKTCGSDYHVYILAEDVNGEKETDYASAPVEIEINREDRHLMLPGKSPILYTPGRRGNLSTQDPQPAAQ